MENVRIDKGVKRKIRAEARKNPLVKTKGFAQPHDKAKRLELIKALPEAILSGKTTKEFAIEHNVPHSTLKSWVFSSEDVEEARGVMLAHELMLRIEEMEDSDDPLALARAREGFRAWSWLAERRESRLYGQKQHIEVKKEELSDKEIGLLESAQQLLGLFKSRLGSVVEEKEIAAPAALPEKPLESE